MITKDQITEFTTAIKELSSQIKYADFCEILGLPPNPDNIEALEKWDGLRDFIEVLRIFSNEELYKMLEAYHTEYKNPLPITSSSYNPENELPF